MKFLKIALMGCALAVAASPALAQVKQTRAQMLHYTSEWKGERFPDGRPKVPDSLLDRATKVPLENIWGFLRSKGYNAQFEGGWQSLQPGKAFAGRALTAQYMPARPDMVNVINAEGKRDEAVAQYKEVLSRPNVYDAHEEAKRGLRHAYKAEQTVKSEAEQ